MMDLTVQELLAVKPNHFIVRFTIILNGFTLSEFVTCEYYCVNTTCKGYIIRCYENVGGSRVINSIWELSGCNKDGTSWCSYSSMTYYWRGRTLSLSGQGTQYAGRGENTGKSVTSYIVSDYPSNGLQNEKYYVLRD